MPTAAILQCELLGVVAWFSCGELLRVRLVSRAWDVAPWKETAPVRGGARG
eukprot:gene22548-62908_t